MASVRSLDNALETSAGLKITDDAGVTQIPDNGRVLRNLIHGADSVMSHITHFYHLSALDFVDASGLGAPFTPTHTATSAAPAMLAGTTIMPNGHMVVTNYVEALAMRRKVHSLGAIFAGRHPIQNAIVPGGVTTLPTSTDVFKFSYLLDQVRNFINTAYVPDVVTVANIAAPNYTQYWTLGTRPGNMLSYGEYPVQTGTAAEELLFPRAVINLSGTALSGAYTGLGAPTAFLGNVREHVGYSYYSSASQLHPSVGKTEPNVSLVGSTTAQQYSWLKAPRFGTENRVCEVGPIARVIAKYALGPNHIVQQNQSVTKDSAGAGTGVAVASVSALLPNQYAFNTLAGAVLTNLVSRTASNLVSVLGRHACRAVECKFLADAMADTGIAKATGQAWLTELRAGTAGDTSGTVFTNLTNPVYVYAKLPTKPKMGAGWAEAPRGALGHWITIEKKKIANYQCVVPSTWNHSPKDDNGNNGAAEAVLGSLSTVPLTGWTSDDIVLTLIRVLHTYDFCIACAVHVVKPDGSTIVKYQMETDGKVTKLPHDAEI